ncbi:MAG: DUF2220 domain-containing protein [Anaerolineae bacterium]|nr:DUF2220 domain-containing protein [Anaerolineae bacterium]
MEISFIPAPDVAVILNALLDKFENRAKRNHIVRRRVETEAEGTYGASRSIKIVLDDLNLPSYFSQIDPQSRIIANQQLQNLEQQGLLQLKWLPGETNHLLHSIALRTELHPERSAAGSTQHNVLYKLIQRTPISDHRVRLESLLLAEKFRYPKEDWRARALDDTLQQLRAGKSPSPFSLTDSNLDLDLLAVLRALPTLTTETSYRVFSVRVFNDSKRFEDLKPSLLRLARRANPEWKSLTSEVTLRELNLVANPGYIHLAGNWELTDINGQIINLDSFTPSVGFPAAQIISLQKVTIRAESMLCVENLTSFHEFTRATGTRSTKYATICLMGNPSPSIRHLLRLIPEEIPIYLWSDMDYGGFKILSQLRKQVRSRIQPYLMDITTFENHAPLSRRLTPSDIHNLKRLALNPVLKDVRLTIEHLLKRGLKLEQEAIQI